MDSVLVKQNFKRLVLAFVFAILAAILIFDAVHAESGHGQQETLRNTNDFYAYVETGENVDVAFERELVGSSGPKYDVTVIVSRPGAADVSCGIAVADPVGSDCTWTDMTASTSGIWRIRFEVPAQTFDYHSWEINVQNGATNIPGRVWSNAYYFSQSMGGQASASPDIKMWYISQLGHIYETDYLGYYGIDSVFQANSFGITQGDTCNTIYESVPIGQDLGLGVDTEELVRKCGGEYKVFFEQLSSDLPASATRWDGETEWINTTPTDPTISGMSFTSANKDSSHGTFRFTTNNYAGTARVRVDTNQNGDFDDAVDRSYSIGLSLNRQHSLDFDGKDGSGNDIPSDRRLTFEIMLGRIGEVHFVNSDPEKRSGGLQVTRHTGTTEGRSIIYWDDTPFAGTASLRCSTTPVLSGLSGVDSTGGVHGWSHDGCANWGNDNGPEETNEGSWGDARYIHDWTYAPSPIVTAEYVYTPVPDGVEPTGIKFIKASPVTIAVGSIVGLSVVILIRRRIHI